MPNDIVIKPRINDLSNNPIIEFTGSSGGFAKVEVTPTGDLQVSSSVSTIFVTPTSHNAGLSGSLTRLTDNTSYLVAGAGIGILSASNGQVTISSTAITSPGSPDTAVQFNNAGSFGGDATFTFAAGKLYLTGTLAQGDESIALGGSSHAEGYVTTASYLYAHSEGYDALASGEASHVEGKWNEARGLYSHAEGVLSIAAGDASHSEGSGSIASGVGSHSEGHLSSAPGDYSHVEGWATIASGSWSHAEGKATVTSGSWSHAEGIYTIARGLGSHAEGSGSLATGAGSHAEGKDATALGDFSHAGGLATLASGYAAFAAGSGSVAAGNFSFAMGEYVIASGSNQTVVGKWNKQLNADSIFVVGNGDSNLTRSDILLVNSGSVMISSSSVASDTIFYVGTNGTSTNSLFESNVVVSGTLKTDVIVETTKLMGQGDASERYPRNIPIAINNYAGSNFPVTESISSVEITLGPPIYIQANTLLPGDIISFFSTAKKDTGTGTDIGYRSRVELSNTYNSTTGNTVAYKSGSFDGLDAVTHRASLLVCSTGSNGILTGMSDSADSDNTPTLGVEIGRYSRVTLDTTNDIYIQQTFQFDKVGGTGDVVLEYISGYINDPVKSR